MGRLEALTAGSAVSTYIPQCSCTEVVREEKHIEQSTQGVMGILSLNEGWNSSLAVVAEMERGGSESQKYLLERSGYFVVKKSRDYIAVLPRVQFSHLFACNPEIDTGN